MPELPEVETVKRTLEPLVKNKMIRDVEVWPEINPKPRTSRLSGKASRPDD